MARTFPETFLGTFLGVFLVAAALMATSSHPVRAESYPDHPVRIVVPFPAGGTADAVPRIIGEWLSRKWGQPVVIDNRPGAAGNIGSEIVYKAPPDGYMLLSAPPPPLVNNQNLYPDLPFDPAKFEPISIMAEAPSGLFLNPDKLKVSSVPELIAFMKQNPGKVLAATQGNGTTSHLTAAMFDMMAGVTAQMVPYHGSAPALQGLIAGNVDLMFDNLGVSLPMATTGKLQLLAVASAHPIPSLPKVPTIAETLPGFVSSAWYAVVAPPMTPEPILSKINSDINDALHDPAVVDKLHQLSSEVIGGTPEQARDFMKKEVERWGKVIRTAHITLQ
jgi:tripartite-type tricarboxylate transporter receptor subunit TctC